MQPPFNLTGYTEIDIHASAPTHCVVLHAVGMELDAFTALTSTGAELAGGAFEHAPSLNGLAASAGLRNFDISCQNPSMRLGLIRIHASRLCIAHQVPGCHDSCSALEQLWVAARRRAGRGRGDGSRGAAGLVL